MCAALVVGATGPVAPVATTPYKEEYCMNMRDDDLDAAHFD